MYLQGFNPAVILPHHLLLLILLKSFPAAGNAPHQVHSTWRRALQAPGDTVAWFLNSAAKAKRSVQQVLAPAAGCTRHDHADILQRVLAHFQLQLTAPQIHPFYKSWYVAGLLRDTLDRAAQLCKVDS